MNARQATLAHAQLRTPRAAAVRVCRFAPAEDSQNWSGRINMGPVVLGAMFALVVLVLALAGSKLARQTLMLIAGLIAAALLAIWFLLRSA